MGVPDRDHTLETLLDWADQALYMAKKSGRNRIILHDQLMTSPENT
jgi:PleD family two-component response regulator